VNYANIGFFEFVEFILDYNRCEAGRIFFYPAYVIIYP